MMGQEHGRVERGLDSGKHAVLSVGQLLAGRYHVDRVLRRGELAQSLLARDMATERSVLIRCLPVDGLTGGLRMRLQHEAAVLRTIQNPWLSAPLCVGTEGGLLFIVCPYVAGVSLATRIAAKPLTVAETLAVGGCLSEALAAAHQHGVLHRNIQPSNVLIEQTAVIGHATLIEFGMPCFSFMGLSTEPRTTLARYMSPEQAGALERDVGESSDLYSVGIVLYECLAGTPPFVGDDVGSILHQHMTARVPELRNRGLEVPRAMDELIQRLLRKDPRERYQSAQAVRADLRAIAEELGKGNCEPAVAVGSSDRRETLTEPAFVGRQHELEQLEGLLRQAQEGNGAFAAVEAHSGGGKTRLLVELALSAVRQGVWVLRGSGLNQVGQSPLQILDGILDDVLAALRTDSQRAAVLEQRLGDRRNALAAALPRIARALHWTDLGPTGPEVYGERRTIEALGLFLESLGSATHPALIVLDDCQWADDLTLKLLADWQRRLQRRGAPQYVSLVAAYRPEDVPAGHMLHKLTSAQRLCLGPLLPGDIRKLVESMAGPVPEEAIDVVGRLSEGSPFMASAVLRGLVESGALVPHSGGWQIVSTALADAGSSSHAAAFLSRRIGLLPAATIELLTVGAVLGKTFDLDIAGELAGLSPSRILADLEEARRRHLVWLRPGGAACVFVHDRVRAALLDRLSPEQHRNGHRRAARLLRAACPDRVFELAYHFDAAGDHGDAFVYAVQAARQARSQYALDVAEQQYRIAAHGSDAMDDASRYEVLLGLGEVLMLRGRYSEAEPLFEQAAQAAHGPYACARVRGKQGELAHKRGDMEAATTAFEEALRLLGRHIPANPVMLHLLLAWEILVQTLHTLFPRWLVASHAAPPSETELLGLRLFSRLAHGYWFVRSKSQVLWAHLRGMNLGERYAPTAELAQAYSEHAPAMSLVGLFRRGMAYAQKSVAIRQSLHDLWGQGQSLSYYGVVLFAASRYHACIDKCREAVRLLERTGDCWENHIARYQIAASLYRLGDLAAAEDEARFLHQSGLEYGDEQASGISLDVWARCEGHSLPIPVLRREVERSRMDAQGTAQVALAEGVHLLAHGKARAAAESFARGLEVAQRAGVCNPYVTPNWAWLATALRCQVEELPHHALAERRRLLGRAVAAARRAVRVSRRFQNDLPHALRERAILAALQGQGRRARRWLDESARAALRQGAGFEQAETERTRKFLANHIVQHLGAPLPDPRSDGTSASDARTNPADLGSAMDQPTLSLADRFVTVLESGRLIASALSPDRIYEEVQQAAIRLLRAEDCLIVKVEPAPVPRFVPWRAPAHPFAENVLSRAVAEQRTVSSLEELTENTCERVVFAGEQAVLCTPVLARGSVAACLYLVRQQVQEPFSPDEQRLAEFIATLAGAALENAEGFVQLQRLNETLEQRVSERTAAAEARAHELAESNRQLFRTAMELRQTEEQLRVAKNAAEEASLAKTQFLATMSHEIRTPMNGILGMTELALATTLTAVQREYLQTVKQSGLALLRLLNDILDFSKIEAGRLDLEETDFNLPAAIADAVRLLAFDARRKGLKLSHRIDADLPPSLRGDPCRLRQVLVNLLGNAVKFTEQGEVCLEARLEAPAEHGLTVHFIVRDTGIGIPAEQQQVIFERFRQADGSTTRRYGGSGLGLAISSQLVNLMGGRIWVESQVGVGSEFHFTANFRCSPNLVEDSNAPSATREDDGRSGDESLPPAAQSAHAVSPLKILLAEDGPVNQAVAVGLLELRGHQVVVADNGQEALERLADDHFDVVLMDLEMPLMDGMEATRRIRQREQLSGEHLPIIAMTAHALNQFRDDCHEVGMDGYLTKPIQPEDLDAALAGLAVPLASPCP